MENNIDSKPFTSSEINQEASLSISETEEHTPQLFDDSESASIENEEKVEEIDNPQTEKLFESDSNNEEEDFEIPAFLRRQKF